MNNRGAIFHAYFRTFCKEENISEDEYSTKAPIRKLVGCFIIKKILHGRIKHYRFTLK